MTGVSDAPEQLYTTWLTISEISHSWRKHKKHTQNQCRTPEGILSVSYVTVYHAEVRSGGTHICRVSQQFVQVCVKVWSSALQRDYYNNPTLSVSNV